MQWRVQEAKQRFSELVRRAVDEGPQTVTGHGQAVAVMLSAAEYQRLRGDPPDLVAFLLDRSGPYLDDLDLDSLERDMPRDVHGLTLATRNTKDVVRTGVPVVNPWTVP